MKIKFIKIICISLYIIYIKKKNFLETYKTYILLSIPRRKYSIKILGILCPFHIFHNL